MNQLFYILYKSKNIGSSCGNYSCWVIKEIISVHYSQEDLQRAMQFQLEWYGIQQDERLEYEKVECPDV